MTTRVIRTDEDRKFLYRFLATRKLPFTVNITAGAKRSNEQNRLSHMWFKEVAEQLGDRTPNDVRAECKLRFGVPLLRAENEDFREKYDRLVRPLPYESKMELMVEPFDMPITRLMTVDQERRFLDDVFRFYTEQGLQLTDPDPFTSPPSKPAAQRQRVAA